MARDDAFNEGSEGTWYGSADEGDHAGQELEVGNVTSEERARRQRGPAYRLADAVLTQAFRDLKSCANANNKATACTYESAREFLLGETPDAHLARMMYCDVLDMDPAFVERMALSVIQQDARSREDQRRRRSVKGAPRQKQVA